MKADHYAEFEFGFDQIEFNPMTEELTARVFIDVVTWKGESRRITITDNKIIDYMISCEYDDLVDTFLFNNPEIAFAIQEEKRHQDDLLDDRF